MRYAVSVTQEVHGQSLLNEGFNHMYIYEGALGQLAGTSEQRANEVFRFMGALRLRGVTGNVLGAGNFEYDDAWENDAAALETTIQTLGGSDTQHYVAPFLWHTGVQIIDNDSRPAGRVVPIGGPIVATCFEQDYHTYGFDEDGTVKMRCESGSIADLAIEIGAGIAPQDLAVVHGPNGDKLRKGHDLLDFNAAALASGHKIIADGLVPLIDLPIQRQENPSEHLPLDKVLALDRAIRTGIIRSANTRIDRAIDAQDMQRSKLGQQRHGHRVAHIESLRHEVKRVINSNRLIRERFYPSE